MVLGNPQCGYAADAKDAALLQGSDALRVVVGLVQQYFLGKK